MNNFQLADETVILRRFTLADAPLVQSLAGDSAVADTTLTIPHPYPDGAAKEWIKTHESQFEQAAGAVFAISAKADLQLIGCISIGVKRYHNHGEIGYWVGREFWGQGYCTAALRLFLPYCFARLDLHRVYGRHYARNPASGRVMHKAGMRREGLLREHLLKAGKYEDVILYGLLHSEHQGA